MLPSKAVAINLSVSLPSSFPGTMPFAGWQNNTWVTVGHSECRSGPTWDLRSVPRRETMSDDRASVIIMHVRVLFSVALSLLASLPSRE